jgi:hypothetical protein
MGEARGSHAAVLLPDGKVLVAGGFRDEVPFMGDCRGLRSGQWGWTSTGRMATGRQAPTATALFNGRVLVAGEYADAAERGAELYDPASGTWTPTASSALPHRACPAVLLPDGRVLIAGGSDRNAGISAELYDPGTQ